MGLFSYLDFIKRALGQKYRPLTWFINYLVITVTIPFTVMEKITFCLSWLPSTEKSLKVLRTFLAWEIVTNNMTNYEGSGLREKCGTTINGMVLSMRNQGMLWMLFLVSHSKCPVVQEASVAIRVHLNLILILCEHWADVSQWQQWRGRGWRKWKRILG